MPISIRQAGPGFVGEVEGIDITRPLDEAQVRAVHDGMNRYAVLVFRDQLLEQERQVALGHELGEPEKPRTLHRDASDIRLKFRELSDVSNLDPSGNIRARDDRFRMYSLGNRIWHTDGSFRKIPARYSMLSAHAVPREGGETEYADLRAAYDALPEKMKAKLEGLRAEHSIFHSRGLFGYTDFSQDERNALPPVPHPLVRRHPGSQRLSLYLGSHASHVVDWAVPEGRVLLYELTDFATRPEFVHRHNWRVGDFVIWDNRCTLHRGLSYDDINDRRDLRRVSTRDVETSAVPI